MCVPDAMNRYGTGMAAGWFLYLLECRDGSYYAGISTDVEARFRAHVAGRGARYTRANPPLRILGFRAYPDRAAASRAEWQIKQQPRERKLAWLLHGQTQLPGVGPLEAPQ